ncbi:MAG: hypothetical protein ACRD4R_05395 [Candidatus Acidiferrales bacterium]
MKKHTTNKSYQDRHAYVWTDAVMVDSRGNVIGVLRDGMWRYPRLAKNESVLPPARLPTARRNCCEHTRRAYAGVQAMIVDTRVYQRGRIKRVLRNDVWRFPRLAPGGSALPPVKLPHVLMG